MTSDPFDFAPPELTTERLRLRALSPADAPAVFAYASDPEVARFTLWPPHPSEAFTIGFLQHFTAPAFLSWAITEQGSDHAIGMVFLHTLNRHHRKAELAFNLSRSRWSRGLATEAARPVVALAFETLHLNRLEATCMPANHGSRKVLEKLGLTLEGHLRRSHARYDGFHDMDLYAKVREI